MDLHNYQKNAVEHILENKNSALFLEMGLGKTVITLTAILELKYYRFQVNKILVIAPKKVAESTWFREIAKWEHLKLLKAVAVLGSSTQRLNALNEEADIYIINRENVKWLVDHYMADFPFDMLVIDELSSFKSPKAKRFKSLCIVKSKIDRIVGLTGTPAPNGLLDLWSQIYLLDGGERLGKRIGQYRERYFNVHTLGNFTFRLYKPKNDAQQAIEKKIDDICLSMRAKDYLELPECSYITNTVVLSKTARKLYDTLEKDLVLRHEGDVIDAAYAASLSNKLLQLCNGAVYDSNRKIINVHNEKLEVLVELIEALNGKPAIVFYNYKHDKTRIMETLKSYNLRELSSPQDEKDWNEGKIGVLLAHPASACYGLNLQDGGNHIIWFGMQWSLELYLQANARLHRQGQKQKVFIHHLVVEGGLDAKVMEALEGKEKTQDSMLEALKAYI